MDVSEESLLDYFYSAGCKVKNASILKTYKPFIGHNDLQLRAKYREEFKLIIDRIAVVKSENGEKYLVLKKRYRQLLQQREAEQHGPDGEGQASPARPPTGLSLHSGSQNSATEQSSHQAPGPAPGQGDEQRRSGQVRRCGGPCITITGAPDQEPTLQNQPTWTTSQPTLKEPVVQPQEPSAPSNEGEEVDKDSGSKSESEQEEESLGSLNSTSVALDPVEKEWIYSAACGRFSDLCDLLRQDPSLANKKDFTSGFTALHWAAKHGKEDMATLVANAGADVNTKSYAGYTPLHIAALHGHRHILDLLIRSYGAKESLRDYSGHLACHYLNFRDSPEGDNELQFQAGQARERRNRKLASLFQSRKKWGSAEELAPIDEERPVNHQLTVPPFRARKFSR